MKKKLLLVSGCIVVVLLMISLLSNAVTKSQELKRYFEITENQYVKDATVFENELRQFAENEYNKIKVIKGFGNTWIVDGKSFSAQKTAFSNTYDPTVNWRVNLSLFVPCGICDDIKIYSYTGECNSDVLVAEENDELFLLAFEDVLSPYQYSCNDFRVFEDMGLNDTEKLAAIWEDHLSCEYNIRHLLMEDDTAFMNIKMQMVSHPELTYSFSCAEYKGNYYSKLPFDETSNGYYDITKRLKEGITVIQRPNF